MQTQRQKPGGTETETLANMDQRGASNVLALGKGNVFILTISNIMLTLFDMDSKWSSYTPVRAHID